MPYNRATTAELKAFARAYAKTRGIESVSKEDVQRDFGIEGRLVDYFGATRLGQIVERARADRMGTEPADTAEPAVDEPPTPEARAA